MNHLRLFFPFPCIRVGTPDAFVRNLLALHRGLVRAFVTRGSGIQQGCAAPVIDGWIRRHLDATANGQKRKTR